ncbi:Ger(x)C family spore germination protein [Paenibacillus lemnae]|uniref:Ger(X)C family spore germination protein n=1 Tax=Paenibacillus lemnae TaxID=1330551 RepID=A0A848M4W0_PAELE|nr:Ger(x)C family spore germination protein [Paenibacillus lemnae]NMO95977.1 Ger(x)C family spore germination protein [Paenibacillus lemnae]
MRRWWIAISSVLPVLLLTGCLAKVEINDQLFVLSLYLDKDVEKNEYTVTISSPLPNRLSNGAGSGSGQGQPFALVTESAPTIPLALNAIQRQMTRKLDFSHTRVIVIGNRLARAGLEDLFNWTLRERALDYSTFVMISPQDARSASELTPVFETMPSTVLKRFAVQNNVMGTTLKDCLSGYMAGTGYAMNQLSITEKPVSSQSKTEKWAGVDGIGLFDSTRLKSVLNIQQTRVIAWAIGSRKTPIYRPVYSVLWDGGRSKASVLFTHSESSKTISMTSSGPLVTIKLRGTADVLSLKDDKRREPTESNTYIIKELNDQIGGHLREALTISQENGADILKIGQLLNARYPDVWQELKQDWAGNYKNQVEFQIKLKLDIRNTDMQTG